MEYDVKVLLLFYDSLLLFYLFYARIVYFYTYDYILLLLISDKMVAQ